MMGDMGVLNVMEGVVEEPAVVTVHRAENWTFLDYLFFTYYLFYNSFWGNVRLT